MQSGSLGYISEYLSDSSTSDHSEALLFCLCNAPSTHYCRNAIIMWLTLKCIFSPVDTHDAISNCSTLGGAKKKKKQLSLVVLLSEGEPERKKGSAMWGRMSWRRGGGEWREEGRDDRTGAERGKRLWEDVIMSRINSKTGGERQRLAR